MGAPVKMKKNLFFVLAIQVLVFSVTPNFGQSEFDRPWKDRTKAIVIDPFQGNSINWDELGRAKRVAGIIHRATIGSRKDTKYLERKAEALKRGYKWGSYHLGKPGDPITQADDYLNFVGAGSDEVVALDIESLDPATDMSLDNAVIFTKRIKEKLGRYPLIYCNNTVAAEINRKYGHDDTFSNSPLWYARFKARVTDFPAGTWKTYTLWQFSSELNCSSVEESLCLDRVPGTKTDMDVNVFNGTVEDLKKKWPF